MTPEDREKLVEKVGEALNACNMSDYTLAELKQHEPQSYNWVMESARAALDAIEADGKVLVDRDKLMIVVRRLDVNARYTREEFASAFDHLRLLFSPDEISTGQPDRKAYTGRE